VTITKIMLNNLPEIVRGGNVQPTDEVLDAAWDYLKTQNDDAVSWAIEALGTEKLDRLLERFTETGALNDATAIRKYMRACFREYARNEIMGYESSLIAAHEHGAGIADLPEYNAETASYV